MNYKTILSIFTIGILALTFSCKCSKKANDMGQEAEVKEQKTSMGPAVIIYKTTADYYNNVPVTLSEDKSEVVNFPGIKDIYFKGEFAYPTKLSDGFLLDNRGVSENSAFLEYSYEQYSKLEATPSAEDLYAKIIDKDPFAEMYHCGSRFDYKNVIEEVNAKIGSKELEGFKKLK